MQRPTYSCQGLSCRTLAGQRSSEANEEFSDLVVEDGLGTEPVPNLQVGLDLSQLASPHGPHDVGGVDHDVSIAAGLAVHHALMEDADAGDGPLGDHAETDAGQARHDDEMM